MYSFDPPLGPDPAIALIPPIVPSPAPGPAHRAQYVIELVGPRSAPASAAAQLLSQNWFAALGQPELYVMSPADQQWRAMTPQTGGSYDSIALCWDLTTSHGSLSRQSAESLLRNAEQFASAIGRRAMPLPTPQDVDKVVKLLAKTREQLDIGAALVVIPRAEFVPERQIWRICARLGLEFSPTGSFDWKSPNHPSPLFSVTPIGQVESFSLAAVNRNDVHEGLTIGFSVPLCPAPMAALDGAIHCAEVIAGEIQAAVFDDTSRPLTSKLKDELRRDLQAGVQMLEAAGLKPGSSAALKVFG